MNTSHVDTDGDELVDILSSTITVDACGTVRYKDGSGRLHRVNGPAVVYCSGELWYRNGLRHRLHGPAVIFYDGHSEWYLHDKLHREDGPAVVYAGGGRVAWFLNDQFMTEEEFNEHMSVKRRVDRAALTDQVGGSGRDGNL